HDRLVADLATSSKWGRLLPRSTKRAIAVSSCGRPTEFTPMFFKAVSDTAACREVSARERACRSRFSIAAASASPPRPASPPHTTISRPSVSVSTRRELGDFMLFTFEDLETGDMRSAVAANEAAARFQLGGIWTDVERAAAFEPCEIDGLPAIYREAEA